MTAIGMARPASDYRLLVLAIVGVHIVLLCWSGAVHFPTIDEGAHFPAGALHWWFGDYRLYNVNPPLVRMVATLPAVLSMSPPHFNREIGPRPEFQLGLQFLQEQDFQAQWHFALAHIAVIPFSLLGAYSSYRLGQIYGRPAALFALSMWCFSPMVLAYGASITPDLGAAACGLFAWSRFVKWLRAPTVFSAVLLGVALGVAQLTKTSWLVLFLLCPAMYLMSWLINQRPRIRAIYVPAVQLGISYVIALCLLNIGYEFERSFRPLGDFQFSSSSLSGMNAVADRGMSTGNRFADSWVGRIPLPLPANYVLGIDYLKFEFERGYPSYLRKQWKHGGWWYYYLYALLVKLPVGTLLLVIGATFVTAAKALRNPNDVWNDLVILTPAAAVLILVSSQTGFNHHVRYVLPALPFFYVWVSQLANNVRRDRPLRSCAILGALTWTIASSLWIYPHSMSYFNELAGGPLNGNQHLHNSNVDWGQDLTYLKKWIGDHPDVKEVGVAAYHWVKLEQMGLPTYEANHWPPDPNHDTKKTTGPLPGWFAISQNHLVGEPHKSFFGRPSEAYHADPSRSYFKRFKPVGSIGYSMLLYHVSLDEANAVRKEFGLSPLDERGKPAKE
jgi:hypothetical protein